MNNADLMTLERQDRIVSLINERGSVTVIDLSEIFTVSEATIRRDLVALAERRLVQRELEHIDEKMRIGKATAQLIHPGETLLLLGGSTGLAVARDLANHHDLTIVTDSLLVAGELLHQRKHKVILAGGSIDPDEQAVRGTLSRLILQQIHVDKVIIGAKAISVARGISAETPEEAELFQACIACADQIIVVTDSSKFQKSALAKVVSIQEIHTLVTDRHLGADDVRTIQDIGVHLILV